MSNIYIIYTCNNIMSILLALQEYCHVWVSGIMRINNIFFIYESFVVDFFFRSGAVA